MQWKHLTLLAALLLAAPALSQEPESGGGDDPPGDDGGGSGGGGGDWIVARSLLIRDAAASDGDVCGHVEVRERGTRQRFQVEAERLTPGVTVSFYVADAAAAMVPAGTAAADLAGEAELELDTGDGATLPAGAATVAELAGRRVEVRDAADGLLLSGTVPMPGVKGESLRAVTRVRDDDSGVRVKISMRVRGRDGRQQFRLEVKRADPLSIAELWIDDGAGTMVKAGEVTTNGRGNAKLRHDSLRGDWMPLDVAGLQDLSGRAFEIRVGGATVAAGVLPTL